MRNSRSSSEFWPWIQAAGSCEAGSRELEASTKEIFSLDTFPEAQDEIEKNAELLPWCTEQKNRKRKLLESLEDDREKQLCLTLYKEKSTPEHPRAGVVYEIKQPLSSSSSLRTRVVMVVVVTDDQVKIRYPSSSSLEAFLKKNAEKFCSLGGGTSSTAIMGSKPELDEELALPRNIAEELFVRPVSCTELLHQGHLESFWMIDEAKPVSPKSWAVRKKSKRLAKCNENLQLVVSKIKSNSSITQPEKTPICRAIQLSKELQGRWSVGRYGIAQQKLFDMMRAKGAKPGNPICRSALREAARKYIGDTGLLDHLLKHMVDKETGDGQRFRRRHNSEGNLEYWLEDADLMQIRKSAGIEDPFWLPPPGWSPGDKLPAGGYSCRGMTDSEAAQIESLKQEVEKLKRQLSRLGSSPAETETLTQNSYPTRRDSETKGEIKSQVETLRASIEELQNAYIHLHELHKENAVFMQKEAGSAKTGNKAEKELRERDNDRLNKLELQVRNIAKEAAVEKLAAESQFKVLWKVVMALQMFQNNKVTVRPMEECAHNRMEQAEIRTLDEEIGWLGLAPPA